MISKDALTVTSAPKYMRRLDFTTGKRVDRGKNPKTSKAVALANELEWSKESTWDLLGHNTRVVAK